MKKFSYKDAGVRYWKRECFYPSHQTAGGIDLSARGFDKDRRVCGLCFPQFGTVQETDLSLICGWHRDETEDRIYDGSSWYRRDRYLVGKVLLDHQKMDLGERVEEIGEVLGEGLLRPARIYAKTILNPARRFNIGGIAHITGGGITGNLPRVVSKRL